MTPGGKHLFAQPVLLLPLINRSLSTLLSRFHFHGPMLACLLSHSSLVAVVFAMFRELRCTLGRDPSLLLSNPSLQRGGTCTSYMFICQPPDACFLAASLRSNVTCQSLVARRCSHMQASPTMLQVLFVLAH